ncbi:MAG TPA: CusA/CzcA family heavy metal efflux RND transporter [Candidatus Binatia bacterium]|nr:CusA/CzcA family heavy metal efflux RND transporter [Candidatus Binatia bacterium]
MIARLLQFALHQRFITGLLGVTLIGLGIWAFQQLKIEAYPDLSDTQVVVITLYPGHAAEEAEVQVTIPIERALNSVPYVIARRSRTIFGLSVVELTFAYGTDDYRARQTVLEKLRDAALPEGVEPTLGPLSTPIGEFYRYSVEGDGVDAMTLRELQDWVIAPRLLQVAGVADVVPFGGLIKQYQIQVDPLALEKYGLSVSQVAQAVTASNQNAGGALLDTQQQAIVVRGVGLIRSIADIENTVIDASDGVPIFVRDVGRVQIGAAPQTGIFSVNDRVGGVEGIVLMRRGENPSEVLRGIKAVVEELNATALPAGVHLVPIYDRTELVDNTLHTVSHTLLEGLVIVVTILFVFLGSVRAALLTAVTIPLSLLFAFVCMHFTGIPANLLSLGALDFGIIVDGTLVMVEHIVRALSAQPTAGRPRNTFTAVRDAALEVERPIFFSLVIIISAYLPLFTLERVERRLFTPMAFTVCYALLGSLLLSLTLIPALATYMFRSGCSQWENPVLHRLTVRYEHAVRSTMQRPWLVVASAFGIVVGAFVLGSLLGSEFLPQLDEGVIWIRANLPPGISLTESAAMATEMRRLLLRWPEVQLVSSQTGRNDSGTDPFGPNRNELLVALRPYATWPAGMRKADLVEEFAHTLQTEIPGATLNFTQPIIDTVTESVTGSSADLAVILSGADLSELRRLAAQTLEILEQVRGAADVAIEQEEDQAQLQLRIDRGRAARYGLKVQEIQDVIEQAIGGRVVSTVFEGERRFDITLRYVPEARADPTAIGNILVAAPKGARVPLAQLADITIVNGASIIARRGNQRQITVRMNIRGRDQGGFVAESQERFQTEVRLPAGYHVEWGGQFENLARARKRLSIILPITIAIIFALLFSAFSSPVYAGLVLMNVPFSLVGGVVALFLRHINLSVSAAVGFISLFGVAVMSGVLIVAEINRQREETGVAVEDAIVQGAREQLRPVLMMIVVALLGMVPAARATGIGSDVQRPLATVVVGGLLSTLLLTLIALPSMYYLVTARGKRGTP